MKQNEGSTDMARREYRVILQPHHELERALNALAEEG
jgi:hypothetical protein